MSIKTIENTRTATEKKKQPARRFWIIMVVVVLLPAIGFTSAYLVLKSQNDQAAGLIIGRWYSETEDLQYLFSADNTFTVTDGQTTIVYGQWHASWKRDTLILTYYIEETARKSSAGYTFNNDHRQIVLQLDNNRQITLRRIGDQS